VKGFVDASSVFQSNESSVLVESACESKGTCDVDMRAFMGIFARTLARTALAAPIVSGSINKLLSTSAKAAASACSGGSDPSCPLGWTADSKWESASAKDGNLGEVFNALGVVQGLLYPSAKALKTAGGVKAGASGTTGGAANGTTGTNAPQNTGAAGTFAASITAVFVVAFAAALSC
jgi:mannan endo-1,6-alpha-mannosidase